MISGRLTLAKEFFEFRAFFTDNKIRDILTPRNLKFQAALISNKKFRTFGELHLLKYDELFN